MSTLPNEITHNNLPEALGEVLQRVSNIERLLSNSNIIPVIEKDRNLKQPDSEQPISQPEAVKFLGKSRQTLIKYRKRGIIKGHVLGGRIYYLRSELIKAITQADVS